MKIKTCKTCKYFKKEKKEVSKLIGYPIYEFICLFDGLEIDCESEREADVEPDYFPCGKKAIYWEQK